MFVQNTMLVHARRAEERLAAIAREQPLLVVPFAAANMAMLALLAVLSVYAPPRQ